MRRTASLGLLLVLALPGVALSATFPKPDGFVTDVAGILPADVEAGLGNELQAFERQTSIEVAVVVVPSLEGETPEIYAQDLLESWGVGKKGKDNGVVVLFAPAEREVRIHTGYGLEADLPDVVCKRIIEEAVIPVWKAGDQPGAVIAGARAIVDKLGTVPLAERDPDRKPSTEIPWMYILIGIVAALAIGTIIGIATGNPFLGLEIALRILILVLTAGKGGKSGSFGGGRSGGGGAGGRL